MLQIWFAVLAKKARQLNLTHSWFSPLGTNREPMTATPAITAATIGIVKLAILSRSDLLVRLDGLCIS